MKNKEALLDLNEPLQFIFSHSALNEGGTILMFFKFVTYLYQRALLKKDSRLEEG